jgi:ribonuclease HI
LDGSRRSVSGTKREGAGIVIREWSIGVSRRTSVYGGESVAIAVAMRFAHKYCDNHWEISQIFFFSDSASAITNITCSNAHPSQAISLLFIKVAKSFLAEETLLHWVAGHNNIGINEHADRLARRGCREDTSCCRRRCRTTQRNAQI